MIRFKIINDYFLNAIILINLINEYTIIIHKVVGQFQHDWKELPKFSEIVKFGFKILKNAENIVM